MTLIETLNEIYHKWCVSEKTRHFEIAIPENKCFISDINSFSKNKRFEVSIMPNNGKSVIIVGKGHGMIEIIKTWTTKEVVFREKGEQN